MNDDENQSCDFCLQLRYRYSNASWFYEQDAIFLFVDVCNKKKKYTKTATTNTYGNT